MRSRRWMIVGTVSWCLILVSVTRGAGGDAAVKPVTWRLPGPCCGRCRQQGKMTFRDKGVP